MTPRRKLERPVSDTGKGAGKVRGGDFLSVKPQGKRGLPTGQMNAPVLALPSLAAFLLPILCKLNDKEWRRVTLTCPSHQRSGVSSASPLPSVSPSLPR